MPLLAELIAFLGGCTINMSVVMDLELGRSRLEMGMVWSLALIVPGKDQCALPLWPTSE